MTANNPMTGEQLDELMTVAVNMQRDAETDCNRPSAMFAYAVQVAVLELRKVRNDASALAAENAGLKAAKEIIRHLNINREEANFCGIDDCYIDDAVAAMITPATDAFLAEVRASAIPEGYVLVPQQIFLEPSDIESICSQCGDGHESGYGDFTDGLLWVGNIQRDDGSIVHGLHISSADYSEDGGVTVCEFAAQLRQGGAV